MSREATLKSAAERYKGPLIDGEVQLGAIFA